MSLRPLLLAAVLALGACASDRAYVPYIGNIDHGARYEKKIFYALKALQATDEQRDKVLEAFDEVDPQLTLLAASADDIRKKWRALDARAPGYREQVEQLASKQGSLSAERLRVKAAFNAKVVTVLTPEQWTGWTNLFRVGSLNEDGDPEDFRYLGPSDGRRPRGYF